MDIRTVCEHFPMVWNDLSILEQLFLQHPARSLENVEVDYRWRLLLFNGKDICGRVCEVVEGDERHGGDVQPSGDRVEAHNRTRLVYPQAGREMRNPTRDRRVFNAPFPFTYATNTNNLLRSITIQHAASSEAKAEARPDPSGHHPQGFDKTRYRVLQVRRQYVCLIHFIHQRCVTQSLASRILFQRGVYPSDDFQMVKKYGQTVLITQDAALEAYLDKYVFTRPVSCSTFINGEIEY